MLRMIFEVVMVLAIVGCLLFMTKVLAKENNPQDEIERQDDED